MLDLLTGQSSLFMSNCAICQLVFPLYNFFIQKYRNQAWQCANSPYRGQHQSKVTPTPGKGEDNHTQHLNVAQGGDWRDMGLRAGLAHLPPEKLK